MPEPDADRKLVLSVLDRLIDLEPKVSSEPATQPSRQLRDLKRAIRRDLEWLLNAKQVLVPVGSQQHLAVSPLTYGLPDISALSLSNPKDRVRLRRAIEEVIERFEPRLKQVVVTLVEGRKDDRTLRFHIDAMLDVDPEPEAIGFDSVLQLQTKSFQVEDDQG